jgi:hypothetical protein
MAALTGLDYQPISVSDLFNHSNFYAVPKYQRGYSWGSEQIRELLDDLLEAFKDFSDDAYLLGQIIVCPSNPKSHLVDQKLNQWDLIDGQQRSTTLYLLLLSALEILDETPQEKQSAQDKFRINLLSMQTRVLGVDGQILPRIKVASNGQDYLMSRLLGIEFEHLAGPTQKNLANSKEEIDSFFRRNFSENSKISIADFIDFVSGKVWLVRLALESDSQAMRVFQKVNNRGLTLDDADLIKNYLFQKVKPDKDFEDLAKMWDTATLTISQARLRRVQSMEFLMKALIGIETGESVSTSKLYGRWEKLIKTEDDAHKLASKLPESARHLVRISKGHIPQTDQKTDLSLGTYMQSWIQQFEILLAGSKIGVQEYEVLLKMVEDRTMLSFWGKEPSQDFERIIHPWAKRVGELEAKPSMEAIYRTADEAILRFDKLADDAKRGILGLSYSVASQRDRIRYVLARVNQSFQGQFEVNRRPLRDYMTTSKNGEPGYDLDHVFPQSQAQRSAWRKSDSKDVKLGSEDRAEKVINSIGNLVLLHNQPNAQQGDALPWEQEKLENLANSELYVNALLTKQEYWPSYKNANGKLSKIQEKYPPECQEWSEEAVDRRADFYWDVLLSDIKSNFNIK